MIRYEILMLTVPEITKDETAELEKSLERALKKANATLISFERWGKYRLSYPVKKNEYGVYFLARLEADEKEAGQLLQDVKALFKLKLNTIVMRDIITVLAQGAPLTYQRPESLEETPAQDVDSFLRKNKMDGLLSSSSAQLGRDQDGEVGEGFDFELEESSIGG